MPHVSRLRLANLRTTGFLLVLWAGGAGFTTRQWIADYHPTFSILLKDNPADQVTNVKRASDSMQAALAFDWLSFILRACMSMGSASCLTCLSTVVAHVTMLLAVGIQHRTWTRSLREVAFASDPAVSASASPCSRISWTLPDSSFEQMAMKNRI